MSIYTELEVLLSLHEALSTVHPAYFVGECGRIAPPTSFAESSFMEPDWSEV